MSTAERILIVGPTWVGDMMMSHTLYQLLKQKKPDCHIDVLAPAWSEALLERMPEVDGRLASPFKRGQWGFRERLAFGRSLRDRGYTQAIVLPNSWKSALVPYVAKIPQRTGWAGEQRYHLLNDIRRLDKKRYALMIERFMALALPKDAPLPSPLLHPKLSVTAAMQDACLNALSLKKPAGRLIALCPGSEFGSSKRWPPQYFAKLAAAQLAAGHTVWLFGSPNDAPIGDEIMREAPDCVNLIGKTDLSQAVDCLSLADVVVSNDSGLMHIAAALARPLVAIFGSTSTGFTPPLGDGVKVLQLNLECQPCFKRECPLGHHRCMRDIYPSQVISEVDSIGVANG